MLNAIKFKAKIKQGVIVIPEEYQQQLSEENEVKVIVIKQAVVTTSQARKAKDIIDYLTENPIKVDGLLSHDEIDNRRI